MKNLVSLFIVSMLLVSSLLSCAPTADRLDESITVASSDALQYAKWLESRLDTLPTDVVIGIDSNPSYGIDMADFEDDGFIVRSVGKDTAIFGKTADALYRAVREYAISAEKGEASSLNISYHEGERIERLTIAGKDVSQFTVVYNDDAPTVVPYNNGKTRGNSKYAAGELVHLLEIACGIKLESSSEMVDGPVIVIDYLTGKEPGYNGFEFKVENGNLYINGGPDANGCANAVYYILEELCGWDALMYGRSYLQESDHIDIPEGSFGQIEPMFDFWEFWEGGGTFKNERSYGSANYNGMIPNCNHGMVQYQWGGSDGGYCYTRDSVYNQTVENVLNYLEAKESAGLIPGEDFFAIDLGMIDALNKCLCKSCAKLYKTERAHSGAMIVFANKLSDEITPIFPGLEFQIIAYHGANSPCKTKPNDNVSVTFATDGACANHPLRGGECTDDSFDFWDVIPDGPFNNDHYAEWLKGWSELTDNLYVWHYSFGTLMHSYAYFENIYDDMMFFKECGVSRYFLNADVSDMCLGMLRFRLMSDIIWHPEMTEEEYELRRNIILEEEYGEGWDLVLEFIEMWESTEVGCWNCWGYFSIIDPTEFDTVKYAEKAGDMYSLLEKAYALCRTPYESRNVGKHMAEVLYRQCYCNYFAAYDANDTAMLEFLEKQFEQYRKIMYEIGLDPEGIMGMGAVRTKLSSTLEESTWIDWRSWRDQLTPVGTTQRPAPAGYEDQ